MHIEHSQEADALYIRLREAEIADSDEIAEDFILDYDKNGELAGIEILSISEKTDMEELVIQSFSKIRFGAVKKRDEV